MFETDYKDIRKEVGVFKRHHNSYFTFELINGSTVVFEHIDSKVLKEFQLKTDKYIDMLFDIEFTEVYDDFESEEFMIYKLVKIKLLS